MICSRPDRGKLICENLVGHPPPQAPTVLHSSSCACSSGFPIIFMAANQNYCKSCCRTKGRRRYKLLTNSLLWQTAVAPTPPTPPTPARLQQLCRMRLWSAAACTESNVSFSPFQFLLARKFGSFLQLLQTKPSQGLFTI